MFDVFTGYSWDEILRLNELFLMGAMMMVAVFAVGAVSATVPSKF
jgi:hypothetical protein